MAITPLLRSGNCLVITYSVLIMEITCRSQMLPRAVFVVSLASEHPYNFIKVIFLNINFVNSRVHTFKVLYDIIYSGSCNLWQSCGSKTITVAAFLDFEMHIHNPMHGYIMLYMKYCRYWKVWCHTCAPLLQ